MAGISRYEKIALGATVVFGLVCLLMLAGLRGESVPYTVTEAPDVDDAALQEMAQTPDSLLPGEKININTAPVEDLQRLPGIGEKRAEDIAAWRQEQGPFASVEELAQISGIGPGTLSAIMDYITVSEE